MARAKSSPDSTGKLQNGQTGGLYLHFYLLLGFVEFYFIIWIVIFEVSEKEPKRVLQIASN